MRITLTIEATPGEILADVKRQYGPRPRLERRVRANPYDFAAKVALHDLDDLVDEPPDVKIRRTQIVILPDSALDEFTTSKLSLIVKLRNSGGAVSSARELARAVHRDIKNVSRDLRVLETWGIVRLEPRGLGKPTRVSLRAHEFSFHFGEAPAKADEDAALA